MSKELTDLRWQLIKKMEFARQHPDDKPAKVEIAMLQDLIRMMENTEKDD